MTAEKTKVGRPVGWRKPEGVRKQRQLRAYDDEWQLIQEFEHKLKKLGKDKAAEVLKHFDA